MELGPGNSAVDYCQPPAVANSAVAKFIDRNFRVFDGITLWSGLGYDAERRIRLLNRCATFCRQRLPS
jgi:hypothetical protein